MEAVVAIVKEPNGPFAIESIDVGDPQAGEVRVKGIIEGDSDPDMFLPELITWKPPSTHYPSLRAQRGNPE